MTTKNNFIKYTKPKNKQFLGEFQGINYINFVYLLIRVSKKSLTNQPKLPNSKNGTLPQTYCFFIIYLNTVYL